MPAASDPLLSLFSRVPVEKKEETEEKKKDESFAGFFSPYALEM